MRTQITLVLVALASACSANDPAPHSTTDTDPHDPDPLDVDDDDDGFTENEGDCDDNNPDLSPGAEEICDNGLDDDCDSVVDDLSEGISSLGPLEYLEAADSPWLSAGLGVYVLEDFEDQTIPADVTVTAFTWSSTFGATVDSVDADDGSIDGSCTTCEALWSPSSITFTFDPVALGGFPTHVGIVVTDTFTANVTATLGATSACASLDALTSDITFGDGSIYSETAEDRFVGFISPAGMTSMTVSVGGAMEVDHLQFGW